jgi:hypothetical protein
VRRIASCTLTGALLACAALGVVSAAAQAETDAPGLRVHAVFGGGRGGLYNRIAPGKIFMWDYATNTGGFAGERCAQPDGA